MTAIIKNQAFVNEVVELSKRSPHDAAIDAIVKFYGGGQIAEIQNDETYKEIIRTTKENEPRIFTFQLFGETEPIAQSRAITRCSDNEGELQFCLVTGEMAQIERIHPKIQGVRGAQSSGASLVSFNNDSSASYNKSQGYNAPVSSDAALQYTTALNHLLRHNSPNKLLVGDTTIVYWSDDPMTVNLYDTLNPSGSSLSDNQEVMQKLFDSTESSNNSPIHVLGLDPNAARVAPKFYFHGAVQDLVQRIAQFYHDSEITGVDKFGHIGIYQMLASISRGDNLPPKLAGDLLAAIIYGTALPYTLYQTAIQRIKTIQNVSYTLATVVKVFLTQSPLVTKEDKPTMALDTNNTNIGYRLGRLFAAIERVQKLSLPDINSSIRERFFGRACTNPSLVFPAIVKLKMHHLKKLHNPRKYVILIEDICAGMGQIPSQLSPTDQGMFTLGYYHQKQCFFVKEEKE